MDRIETWSNIMRVKDMIDKKQRVQLLNSFKWRVVGPYFCYQFYGCQKGNKDKIIIKEVFPDGKKTVRPDLTIDLTKFGNQIFDLRKIKFIPLPQYQYLYKKNNGDKEIPEFYENLLQLTIED